MSIQLFSAVKNVNGDDQINRRISDMTLLLDDGEDDNDDDIYIMMKCLFVTKLRSSSWESPVTT